MPTVKDALNNKLTAAEEQLAAVLGSPAEDQLMEQVYWLEQAMRSVAPQGVLEHAFTLHKETNGVRGLPNNFLNTRGKENRPASPAPAETPFTTVRPGDSLWGILYRVFASGNQLDDPHFADVFRRLPPSAQSHFVDAVEDHIRSVVVDEQHNKTSAVTFGVSNIDRLQLGASLRLDSVLRDEELLLRLISKAKEITSVKEEIIQENGKKITDWLRYHQAEPHTEAKFEEIVYGLASAAALSDVPPDEIQALLAKAKHGAPLTPREEDILAEYLPPYERKIRDRFTMSASEYIRMRSVVVEKLLEAVPVDEKQLSVIAKSAVRQELLDVPEEEFYTRVRAAQLVRAYSFGKDLRNVSVRQFFRGIVENT